MSFLYHNYKAIKQLKKVVRERAIDEAEGEIFLDKAIKHISKRCLRDKMIENLSECVTSKRRASACVLVKRTSEKHRGTAMDRGNTHLLSCRIFRFGWLLSVNDLKSTPNCPHPYTRKAEMYCINPYHYDPPKAKVAGVTVQKDRFPFPEKGFTDPPDDDYIPNHTLSPDNPLIVRRKDNDDDEMGSHDSNFSEDVDMEDATGITEDPRRPGLFTVPFEERVVGSKSVMERGDLIRKRVDVHGQQFTIDSSTNPHTMNDNERLSVGYITGMETVRDKWLEGIRRSMGKGVRLYHSGGEIYIECLSDSPIFVQSPAANRRYGMPLSSVVKVDPKTTLKILNYSEFSNDLSQAVEHGYEPSVRPSLTVQSQSFLRQRMGGNHTNGSQSNRLGAVHRPIPSPNCLDRESD
ncbi:hypothetical protein PENTCL1PPCAC_22749 [Pristionchus entomophagus]|uniref:Mothers against decapentaplegic homolog n=1 Tax=Pristionchus entomophagus TaxID=358040 RepID=A0AAV5U185_9BILA|nr:hypothetical protein PENTCL1PPCAC_22749 [Pristionchus entomophagus]